MKDDMLETLGGLLIAFLAVVFFAMVAALGFEALAFLDWNEVMKWILWQ